MNKPEFLWNEDTGTAICIISTPYGEFKGTASCHPDDNDMISEKVGNEIAEIRATINLLKYRRDCWIKPALSALKQLQSNCLHSKKYSNPKSHESRMLKRQIENWTLDLETTRELISNYRAYLKGYIEGKEQFYQKVRANRIIGQK